MSLVGNCSLSEEEKKMDIDNRAMMNELGGAFMVSWLVLASTGLGMDTLEGCLLYTSPSPRD